jgi:outer membrane protein OmpA-like peptidoglycan-associated protein
MKSLKLLPLLLALPFSALAAPEITASVSGGTMITDDLEVLGPAWIVIPRVGWFADENIGLELDVGYQQGKTRVGEFGYSAITPRLNLLGRIWTKGERNEDGTYKDPPPIHPTLAAGIGGFFKNTNDDGALGDLYNRKDFDVLLNAGPGLMVPLGPAFLRTDFRWVLSLGQENFQNRGDQFINWEWTAGIGFSFGGEKDADEDGILDGDDSCVNVAEDMDNFEDTDGCPEDDNDQDGILDADDKCPINDKEDKDEYEDADGCADPDNDGDTILDGDDQCPQVPGHASAMGCPDQDGDAILDADDECVDEAGEKKSFGCPDEDGDRVPDYRDDCPDAPGPKAADPLRSDGCPATVFVTETAITITDKVFFDTGKATIKPVSFPLLDTIAATLKKYPGIKKVSVEGHTDNVGVPAANQTLSENRAKSVLDYLVTKGGIDAARLESKGFGQTKPLVEGDLANVEEGRSQNRRVEFNILEQEQTKTAMKRPTIVLKGEANALIDVPGLKPTKTPVPADDFIVEGGPACKATLTISAEGKVTKTRVTECIGVQRLAVGKAFAAWEFEPYMIEGKAAAITTVLTMNFKDGKPVVTHDSKAIKPIQ